MSSGRMMPALLMTALSVGCVLMRLSAKERMPSASVASMTIAAMPGLAAVTSSSTF
ncbi:hypothetical protein D3C80_1788030 [compost metagenome]